MQVHSISDFEAAPDYVRTCYTRVTGNLANCPVRILSRKALRNAGLIPAQIRKPQDYDSVYEYEAKLFYESLGYRVTRIGRAIDLKNSLSKALPGAVFHAFYKETPGMIELARFYREELNRTPSGVLNPIPPDQYPVDAYPPDLFVYKSDHDWMFIEVKGPNDSMHFRQANWYVNVVPKEWQFEIFASLNAPFEEMFVVALDRPRSGPGFQKIFDAECLEAAEFESWSFADRYFEQKRYSEAVKYYERYLGIVGSRKRRPNKHIMRRYNEAKDQIDMSTA